ncbi:MAG: hypothetical protein M3R35_05680 [Candidatus Eremiobacteraeota bacterium]|nr:hypothetical protein [Candidatus Eremiobacteraeota bacterium]
MNLSRIILLPAALGMALAIPAIGFAQVAPAAPAQNAPTTTAPLHRHHHGARWMRAMHGIALSTSQKQQIKQLMTSYRQSHPKGSAPDKQSREQMRAQVLNVLTPSQRAQYQQNLQNMPKRTKASESAKPSNAPTAQP